LFAKEADVEHEYELNRIYRICRMNRN
jgi:hypothetical protein